jgi:hypothetical protein
MTPSYSSQIIGRIYDTFSDDIPWSFDDLARANFAPDDEVQYETTGDAVVSEHCVVGYNEVDKVFSADLAGGPSWIHANLLRARGGEPFITLRIGPPVGNPHPTINVSRETGLIDVHARRD